MPTEALVQRAKELVRELSRTPRFAGSPEEAAARELCRNDLERAGLRCVEQPFEYSQWPGKWGVPASGLVQLATILLVARTAMERGALFAMIVGAAIYVALILASGDARRRWIQVLPVMRARAVNLEARRGEPKVWLVAHLDSKSQTVPMLVRIASAVALAVVMLLTVMTLSLSMLRMVNANQVWPAVETAAVIAALPSIICLVRNDSPGTLDNASGVAAVLLAARELSALPDLGVLITSGEELGLAGARIWALQASPRVTVLNCDTIDDAGAWLLMYSGSRPRRIAVAASAGSLLAGVVPQVRRMIPGILADSMAFADRGIEAVTLSRGSLSTLARIHTRRDNSIAFIGSGVADASALLAALTRNLS